MAFQDTYKSLAAMKPAVRLALPPLWFFRFPPSSTPQTLPPPPENPTLAHPFTIPTNIYNAFLDSRIPFGVALVYISAITYLNSLNASRGYKPWAFSKTSLFRAMVITHNILLAVYSAWTFVGMINALDISFYSPRDQYGLAGVVDSLCKINGPRGVGSAALYNEKTSAWGITNRAFHLGADGLTPDVTDVGRLWNEGLAFYGWLFYMSKFYEVIDTLIIIAKGKRSSFLQIYHHAGAMICMWAGIRYMSAPIWMFVLVNSFIHTIMYTFYLCSASGVKVPQWFKRSLTTLQIAQFVVGASYAFLHLFVEYQSPISVPYLYHLGSAAQSIASDASSVISTATAVASADFGAQAKKFFLRAAGREGLAENVLNRQGQTFGVDAINAAKDFQRREETRYRDELQWTHCLDTSGQAFAIWLNVVYLLPLAWLFGRFFVKSYLQQLERKRDSTPAEKAQLAIESARDARIRTSRRLSHAFEDVQGGDENGDEIAVVDDEEFKREVKDAASKTKKTAKPYAQQAKAEANSAAKSANRTINKVKKEIQNSEYTESISEKVSSASETVAQSATSFKEEVKKAVSGNEEGMSRAADTVKQQADLVKDKAGSLLQAGRDKAGDAYESVKSAIPSSNDTTTKEADKQVSNEADDDRAEEGSPSMRDSTWDVVDRPVSSPTESNGKKLESGEDNSKNTEFSKDESTSKPSAPTSSKSKSNETKGTEPTDDTAGQEHELPEDNEAVKKEQDKIIDESESVRDEPLDSESRDSGSVAQDDNGTGRKEEEKAELSPKEEVRGADRDEGAQAEANTGDAKEAETPARESTTSKKSQDTASPKKSNKENLSIKDSNLKGSSGKDFTSQAASGQKSPKKSPRKLALKGNKKPQESAASMAEDKEGRQKHYEDERGEALEKLKSAQSEESDITEPTHLSKDVQGEVAEREDKLDAQPSKAEKEKIEKDKPSFDNMYGEAMEKLKSANSEPPAEGDPGKPEELANKKSKDNSAKDESKGGKSQSVGAKGSSTSAADKPADDPNSPDYDQQKESWIQVDEKAGESERKKSEKETEKAPQTPTKSQNSQSEDQEGAQSFERLKLYIDPPSKASLEALVSSGETNDAAKQEQDKIIDESEPVREEPKDSEDVGSASPKWHQRRRGKDRDVTSNARDEGDNDYTEPELD